VKKQIRLLTTADVKFGQISEEFWGYPPWYSAERAQDARERMRRDGVFRGDMESYHHMCRFFSGFFYRHPLVQGYEFYWRVEPNVKFPCDIDFDPFAFMKRENKVYSFSITMIEYASTITSLWPTTQQFKSEHPEYIADGNFESWITNENGDYNLCHFWSNFEIARVDFFTSPAYEAYFNYLDHSNGFFDERWGDAPVHTMAAAMFLRPDQVHFWEEIGYTHDDGAHCPMKWTSLSQCDCDRSKSASRWECTGNWVSMFGPPKSSYV